MAFGDSAPLLKQEHTLAPLPDFPLRTKLAMEKEIAGVYITGHPLDDYRAVLDGLSFPPPPTCRSWRSRPTTAWRWMVRRWTWAAF